MRIELTSKPTKPIIIQGFPGFGLIGTITTEYLIDHLKAKLIGEFIYDELPPTIAIHQNEIVKPMAAYYDKKSNIIILHTILTPKNFEWLITEEIIKLAKSLQASKIICIEGVMSQTAEGVYSFGDKKLVAAGAKPIAESIIMGVTAGIMTRHKNVSCLFAETHSQLPDSKAASRIIEVLDKYLNLKIDPKPLLEQAQLFENKLRNIMQQANKTELERDRKQLSYLG